MQQQRRWLIARGVRSVHRIDARVDETRLTHFSRSWLARRNKMCAGERAKKSEGLARPFIHETERVDGRQRLRLRNGICRRKGASAGPFVRRDHYIFPGPSPSLGTSCVGVTPRALTLPNRPIKADPVLNAAHQRIQPAPMPSPHLNAVGNLN